MQVSEPWLSACAQVSAVSAWHVTPSWLRVLPCLACLGMLAPAVVSVGAAMQQHISTRLSAIQGEPGLVSNGPVAAATATSASSVSPGHAAASIACAAQGLTAVQAEVQRLLHNSLCFTAPMLSGLSSVCLHRVPQDTDDEHKLAQAQMAFATSTLGFTPYCSADALVTDGQPAALASVLAASKKMDARSRELLRQLQAPSAGPQVVKQLGKYLQAASALSDSMAAISCVPEPSGAAQSVCVCVCVCVSRCQWCGCCARLASFHMCCQPTPQLALPRPLHRSARRCRAPARCRQPLCAARPAARWCTAAQPASEHTGPSTSAGALAVQPRRRLQPPCDCF
jgi:hypothetical protein